MALEITWRPHPTHGELSAGKLAGLPETAFAFPKQRALPLVDEAHVRQAIEEFDEVEGVKDDDRELAFANIQRAAAFYRVPMSATDWRQLGKRPPASYSRPPA